jgi:regulation of enolase protein 1 (concanavalin A-like superfamily)
LAVGSSLFWARGTSVVEWDGSFDSYIRKLKPAASRGCFSSHRASIDPIPVRLTRRGDTFTAEAGADGKKWEVIQTTKVTAPDKLLVGLFARNTLSDAAEVAFTDYTITKPE